MSVARYQPQGLLRLSKWGTGAQVVVCGASDLNVASGKMLSRGGSVPNVRRNTTPKGISIPFRKDHWLISDQLPAIGTGPFVDFWYGVPSSDQGNKGNSTTDPTFLVGAAGANMAIVARLGAAHVAVSTEHWGTLYHWADTFISALEVLPTGVPTLLVVTRNSSGKITLWRDGVPRNSVSLGIQNIVSTSFVAGAFVNDPYWTSSSDLLLAGRLAVEWSDEQIKAFSANPWQIFESSDAEHEDDVAVQVTTGYVDTIGSAVGVSSVTAVARAIAQAYGTSVGIGAGSATVQTLVSATGSATGSSGVSGVARSVFQIVGAAQGSSAAAIPTFTVTQAVGATQGTSTAAGTARSVSQAQGSTQGTSGGSGTGAAVAQATGRANGASTAQAGVQIVTCASGSSQGSAILSGNAACVWHVAGNAAGVSAVAGYSDASTARVFFDTQGMSYGTSNATASAKALANASGNASGTGTVAAKANAVSNAAGSATGASFVVAEGQTLVSAIGAALGGSSASGRGAMVISATGQAVAASLAAAQGQGVQGVKGAAAGSSSTQAATIVIYEAVGHSLSTSVVQGVLQTVIQAIGHATGTATVSGTTEGGVHYTASGDKLRITLTFAPYAITAVDSAPYNIKFKDR